RVIAAFASRAVQTDASMLGDMTVSMLEGERGPLKKEFEKLIDWVRDEPVPDVINLPNSLLIALAEPLARTVRRPVCCTLQGEELFIQGLQPRYRDRALGLIREQVRHVDRFIAVSDYCAGFMGRLLHIPDNRMSVVPLGIDTTGYGPPSPEAGVFTVGYFARIAPEKGLLELAQAYVAFRRRLGADARTRLRAAGYNAPGPSPYLDRVRRTLADAGLADEFAYEGELDRNQKLAYLRSLDVLSVPATYDEPKGLFLIEAMASGIPVVQPSRGAFVEVLTRTGGGLLIEGDGSTALADGLHALWSDPSQRRELGAKGAAGVQKHYTLAQSTTRLLDVYADVIRPGSATRPRE
ncbi:MAG: glycosyltransferase family 4 protein, partial [Vicinamibacterales bacterium]